MTKKSLVTMNKKVEAATLDKEWVSLMKIAREQGMTITEIRNFFAEAAASSQHYVNRKR